MVQIASWNYMVMIKRQNTYSIIIISTNSTKYCVKQIWNDIKYFQNILRLVKSICVFYVSMSILRSCSVITSNIIKLQKEKWLSGLLSIFLQQKRAWIYRWIATRNNKSILCVGDFSWICDRVFSLKRNPINIIKNVIMICPLNTIIGNHKSNSV